RRGVPDHAYATAAAGFEPRHEVGLVHRVVAHPDLGRPGDASVGRMGEVDALQGRPDDVHGAVVPDLDDVEEIAVGAVVDDGTLPHDAVVGSGNTELRGVLMRDVDAARGMVDVDVSRRGAARAHHVLERERRTVVRRT